MTLTFVLFFLSGLVGGTDVESHEVSVMEGDSLTLYSNASDIQLKNEIEWRFDNIRIAKIIKFNPTYYDNARFRGRLKLHRNGSLTITESRTTDTGVYELSIVTDKESNKRFRVTVYAPLSVPVIASDMSKCSSSSRCVLLCSVTDVTRVNLSWYKGNSLLSSISVSDLSNSLSFPLEVEYQENNSYSCVINNPFGNLTKHVCITDLCRLCTNEVQNCGGTEAVIRLVVTGLVGVAAVVASIVLVYDIRSRRAEEERHHNQSDGSDTLKQK